MLPWNLQLATIAAASTLVMLLLWAWQRRTKDAGIVDVAWAACLGAAAAFCAITGEGDPIRRALIGTLGGLWGLRLALHLFRRGHGQPEDGRYQMMRQKFGPRVNAVFLAFFLAQAVAVVILSPPFLLASSARTPAPSPLDLLALAVWIIGIVGESIADRQLTRFRLNPDNRGKVCTLGLWRFSRHPNYFFEWLIWIAFALLASAAPLGWLAWSAPALILFFVLKLTGIPPTEARALKSRGDAYRLYQQTTSPFFPWFPKRPHAPSP